MFSEIALHILDITQNSIDANATLIQIHIHQDLECHILTVTITDNGCGMTELEIGKAIDPFFTSRTTRNIGLGIPFLRAAALQCTGSFTITSSPNIGTCVKAVFDQSNIDCIPLGDITSTILQLISMNETIDFLYTYSNSNRQFTLDTREIRSLIYDISFHTPYVRQFLKEYLNEHHQWIDSEP